MNADFLILKLETVGILSRSNPLPIGPSGQYSFCDDQNFCQLFFCPQIALYRYAVYNLRLKMPLHFVQGLLLLPREW